MNTISKPLSFSFQLEGPKDEETLLTLSLFLKDRIDRRATLITDLNSRRKFRTLLPWLELDPSQLSHLFWLLFMFARISFAEEQFRSQLLDVERDRTSLKRKVEELEEKLSEKERECGTLAKKLRLVEKDRDDFKRTTRMYEQENMNLERRVRSISILGFTVLTTCPFPVDFVAC